MTGSRISGGQTGISVNRVTAEIEGCIASGMQIYRCESVVRGGGVASSFVVFRDATHTVEEPLEVSGDVLTIVGVRIVDVGEDKRGPHTRAGRFFDYTLRA